MKESINAWPMRLLTDDEFEKLLEAYFLREEGWL